MEELTITEDPEEDQYKNDATSQPISTTIDDDNNNNNTPKAPDGVPTVKSWEVRKDGGILGLIYGSPNADDGDYIETSPIVDGAIDNCSVVSTQSGSRYFLSPDPRNDPLDTLFAFKNPFKNERTTGRRRQGATITLAKNKEVDDEKKTPLLSPRSTFSLFDLLDGGGGGEKKNKSSSETTTKSTYSTSRRLVPPPPPEPQTPPSDKIPPKGTPTLTGCVFNEDGTITGYIFGSQNINYSDGYLVTTSPIVNGERKQFEMVTTATGSLYFLG